MTVVRKRLGSSSESLAAQFLEEKGFFVIEKNFRCPVGEIDLIARDKTHLVFVEVKSRRSLDYGDPSLAVNWKKQNKLVLLAKWYLKMKNLANISCRFDVVSVFWPLGGNAELRHFPNAFPARR